MPRYIVAAGSSHPLGIHYLKKTHALFAQSRLMTLHGQSAIYKNASVGMRSNRLFYNCAFALFTSLEPLVFYRELKTIEQQLGRIRPYKNAPRTIDLDVLIAFDLLYNSPTFSVPHKEFFKRNFFMICANRAIASAQWPMPHSLKSISSSKNYLALCS